MKHSSPTVVALVATVLFAGTARADRERSTSDYLVEGCRIAIRPEDPTGSEEMMKALYCYGYLTGYANGWNIHQTLSKVQTVACIPKLSGKQAAEVYVLWSSQHPEKRHLTEWETVTAAFVAAFRCEQER